MTLGVVVCELFDFQAVCLKSEGRQVGDKDFSQQVLGIEVSDQGLWRTTLPSFSSR